MKEYITTKKYFVIQSSIHVIFVLHVISFAVLLIGWSFKSYYDIYIVTLIISTYSNTLLWYCFLSKREFDLRRVIDKETKYNYAFFTYYSYKLFGKFFSDTLAEKRILWFLWISLILNSIYFLQSFV
jgi:hypothetical protein